MCICMISRAMRPAMKPRMIDQMMCNIGSVGRRDCALGRSRLRMPDHVSVSPTSVDSFTGVRIVGTTPKEDQRRLTDLRVPNKTSEAALPRWHVRRWQNPFWMRHCGWCWSCGCRPIPLGRAAAGPAASPTSVDGHPLCAAKRHPLGTVAPGTGLRLGHDLLAVKVTAANEHDGPIFEPLLDAT
jgi:hypothetical protein